MSKYLIFDASAAGKPKSWKAAVSDTFNWPRLIHLSWIVLDENLKPIEDYNCMVQIEGVELTSDIEERHTITAEDIEKKGDPLSDVLSQFEASVQTADYIFAHNLAFNEGVVGAEYIRLGQRNILSSQETLCLMHEGTYYAKIPSRRGGGYKWPSLQELHAALFRQKYAPANNARADVIAASRCFIMLMRKGAWDDIFEDD